MQERNYQHDDLTEVIETYTVSIRELAAPFYSAEALAAWAPIPADEARWRERLAGLQTIVSEENGVIAGFASYKRAGYLDFLFTRPGFARRGVASGLYLRVESALLAANVANITTHSSLAGRPFFDRQGFQVEAEECVEVRGVSYRRFAMQKVLRHESSV